jgi:hypothetical protein
MDTTALEASPNRRRGNLALAAAALLVVFLSTWHLVDYPLTWYDEGSHLHVPKTLVLEGVYADRSSEGFRYYGPTIGVGPTVLLPIAGVFKVAGIGLFQARLVMVVYLLATIAVFWRLAGWLGGRRLAWVATALLVSSRGVGLLEYGRQALGEVPGLFFITSGLLLWFSAWEKATWRRLTAVGLLLGLAVVTKTQFFIVLAPTLLFAWLANLLYYRSAPQRVFLVPGVLLGACFALWQVYVVVFLGPGAVSENLALYRAATASAATVFSPTLMKRAVTELLSLKVYLGWLVPALAYGFFLAVPRRRDGHQWSVLIILVGVNLAWYVVASVSWIRYAFPALAISSLFVARFFHDLTNGFRIEARAVRHGPGAMQAQGLRAAILVVLVAMIALPLAQTLRNVVAPGVNGPLAMATYLDQHVPRTAVIETWEPELGFLTDHRCHFPPQRYLYKAVSHVWLNGPSPADEYRFSREEPPDYVVVGTFAAWVGMYPPQQLEGYVPIVDIENYRLFTRAR